MYVSHDRSNFLLNSQDKCVNIKMVYSFCRLLCIDDIFCPKSNIILGKDTFFTIPSFHIQVAKNTYG